MTQRRRGMGTLGVLCWLVASLGLVVFFILSPSLFSHPAAGKRLGSDLPVLLLVDPGGRLTVDAVSALPDSAFTPLGSPLNRGYTRDVYWLRVPAPPVDAAGADDPSWLEVLPTYLDRVTLYQRDRREAGSPWHAHSSGDTVPTSERLPVRQLVFPLLPGEPFILRIQTTSPMQLDGTVWHSTGLMAHLSSTEWASGVHQGINLMHALLIIGAALALRMRSLAALAVASVTVLVHGAADRGYLQMWLPGPLAAWGNVAVSVGTLVLPAALAWQFCEVLTGPRRWCRTRWLLMGLGLAPVLCLASIPLGRYSDWAWVGIIAPWAISAVVAVMAWCNLYREGPRLMHVLMALPSTAYGLIGLYVSASYLGLATAPELETSILWQLNTLVVNIVVTVAVGTRLIQRFSDSMARLAESEHELDERVRQRTAELLQTQNTLQAALHSERAMREEQRQFFAMVNHEFRTPLAVMDSAATELLTFPTHELAPQRERAAQIRRACRRLAVLVDNCLVSERLDTAAFRLQLDWAPVSELLADAVQLVQWSRRHRLVLDVDPRLEEWECDATLVRIALSNLVDNAVKYAREGEIAVSARLDAQGRLRLSVCDEGPGLPPGDAGRLFERGQRGSGPVQGFGLGLWAVRRIAELHGGTAEAGPSAQGGSCFTIVLPPRALPQD